MKNISILVVAICFSTVIFAQAPEKMSYQAIIRDAGGLLVANQEIGMQISILQGAGEGSAVYSETHTVLSNENGLVSIEVGTGTASTEFSAIDWANGPYFLKTETDPDGGTNYTIAGTSQLLSVPYALHAQTAGAATEADPVFGASAASGIQDADTAYWNGKQDKLIAGPGIRIEGNTISATGGSFYLGQDTLGGIVFYLYHDRDGEQHGLIVSKNEHAAQWQSTESLAAADRSWDGSYNTEQINGSPAVAWVKSLGAGWYLPSVDELSLLWQNRFHANRGLDDTGASLISYDDYYWSSTEGNAEFAFTFTFFGGYTRFRHKTTICNVRAVRAF